MMKKKLMVTILLLTLLTLMLHHCTRPSHPRAQRHAHAPQLQKIVAPAVLDSSKDVTHLATLQPGMVATIHVHHGQLVKQGSPLLSLDATLLEHELAAQKIKFEEAQNQLRIQTLQLSHAEQTLARYQHMDPLAINQNELTHKKFEVTLGKLQQTQAEQKLALAQQLLEEAQYRLKQTHLVAPKDGIILKIKVHEHEYVGPHQPLIELGDAQHILVRVAIDERDIRAFDAKGQATLMIPNADHPPFRLTFIELTPSVVILERLNVTTRVQEALYSLNRQDFFAGAAGQEAEVILSARKHSG